MTFPVQTLRYRGSSLHLEDVPLAELASRYGTPLYVYSQEALESAIHSYQRALKSLPCELRYAVKANSSIAILQLMVKNGLGFDIVSAGELFRTRLAGASSHRVVFSGVAKTRIDIEEALKAGVEAIQVESASELELIDQVANALNTRAPIALRVNPGVDPKVHPHISTGIRKAKFGIPMSEVSSLFEKIHRSENLLLRGLSMHLGSQMLSLKPLAQAFESMSGLWEKAVKKDQRKSLEFLNLGGGLGIRHQLKDNPPDLKEFAGLIQKNFFAKNSSATPKRILLEPGRSLIGNAGILLSTLVHEKKTSTRRFLILDAGMNDFIRPAFYGSHHEITPERKFTSRSKSIPSEVVGPVCESSDSFASRRPLPEGLKPGDLLAIQSTGAYGMSMASHYNSRPKAAEVLVEGSNHRLIRERETWQDLVRGETYL